jgi:hypothetical protein
MDRSSSLRFADLGPPGRSQRWRAGHWAVAGIAAVQALILQSSREQLSAPAAAPQWRLAAAVAIALSTAWLVSVVWCHVRLAQMSSLTRRWPTLLQALGDFGVAIVTLVILRQGHESPLASAGVWLLLPALLAVAVPSAVLEFARSLVARHHEALPEPGSPGRATYLFVMLRAASLIALLASLAWLAMQGRMIAKIAPLSPRDKSLSHKSMSEPQVTERQGAPHERG